MIRPPASSVIRAVLDRHGLATRRRQQERFDEFIAAYNNRRHHTALDRRTLDAVYLDQLNMPRAA